MLKPITGTWFEFHHHNLPEGIYWNPVCRRFTDEQWETKIAEMASIGLKYVVLMASSMVYPDSCEAYFRTDIYPRAEMAASDPMEAMFRAADRHNMNIFVGTGFYGFWQDTYNNMTSPEVTKRAFKAMEQLYAQYGHHPSFYGWYLPDELGICPYYPDEFIRYTNIYTAHGKSFSKNLQVLIAPYGTNMLKADDLFVKQLERLDCDIIAYQDEVGVRKSTPIETPAYYEALRTAHDKAGRAALWADMEIFEFEGEVYKGALIPAKIERIEQQIRSIAPYVDEILMYQYLGMFNKPDTDAFCGHPNSTQFYNDYAKWFSTHF